MSGMRVLSAAEVARYERQGWLAPLRAFDAAEAASYRARLEAFEAAHDDAAALLRHKPHLLLTWLDAMIRHPGILDAVEDLIGPDILVWGSSFFIKQPHDAAFVSWHQDSTYWGLEPADIVTAWVALSPSLSANGAMRVIPGTHTMAQVPHRDTFAPHNLLSRGQEIAVEVDAAQAVTLELQPGEMSLHHVRLIHGSEPNPSAMRRIGFAIRYLPTHVRQTAATHDTATLVRGVDAYGHFGAEQRPEADFSPAAVAHHLAVTGRQQSMLMRQMEGAPPPRS
jgi:hypothetical protein